MIFAAFILGLFLERDSVESNPEFFLLRPWVKNFKGFLHLYVADLVLKSLSVVVVQPV